MQKVRNPKKCDETVLKKNHNSLAPSHTSNKLLCSSKEPLEMKKWKKKKSFEKEATFATIDICILPKYRLKRTTAARLSIRSGTLVGSPIYLLHSKMVYSHKSPNHYSHKCGII